MSGPDTGSPCVFPFIFEGVTYTACAEWGDGRWCSTQVSVDTMWTKIHCRHFQVDAAGVHTNTGDLKWGYCSDNCHSASTISSTVDSRVTFSIKRKTASGFVGTSKHQKTSRFIKSRKCNCSKFTKTIRRKGRKTVLGNCQSRFGGYFWCFVDNPSNCRDYNYSETSNRYWSFSACYTS